MLDLCEREREQPICSNNITHGPYSCFSLQPVSTCLFTHANCNIKNRIHDLPLSLSGQQYDMNALRVQGFWKGWQEDFANWKGPISMVFQSISFTIFQKSSKNKAFYNNNFNSIGECSCDDIIFSFVVRSLSAWKNTPLAGSRTTREWGKYYLEPAERNREIQPPGRFFTAGRLKDHSKFKKETHLPTTIFFLRGRSR